jgi:hypothetical protein
MPPVHFGLVILEMGFLELFAQADDPPALSLPSSQDEMQEPGMSFVFMVRVSAGSSSPAKTCEQLLVERGEGDAWLEYRGGGWRCAAPVVLC